MAGRWPPSKFSSRVCFLEPQLQPTLQVGFIGKQSELEIDVRKAYQGVLLGLISVGNRIGQREKMKYNTVTLKTSAGPIRNSGAGMAFQSCPKWRQKGPGLDTTTLTSHWIWLLPERGHGFGQGSSSAEGNSGKETHLRALSHQHSWQLGERVFQSWRMWCITLFICTPSSSWNGLRVIWGREGWSCYKMGGRGTEKYYVGTIVTLFL